VEQNGEQMIIAVASYGVLNKAMPGWKEQFAGIVGIIGGANSPL